jgi:hypothetical protein
VGDKTYLIVTGERNVQHTGIVYGLDGATGEIKWKLNEFPNSPMDIGSYYISVWDMDGDGDDEFTFGYGNDLVIARAGTGEVISDNFMTGLFREFLTKNQSTTSVNLWVSQLVPIPVGAVKQGGKSYAQYYLANGQNVCGLASVKIENRCWVKFKQFCLKILNWFADLFKAKRLKDDPLHIVWMNDSWDYSGLSGQCAFDYNGKLLIVEPGRRMSNEKNTLRAVDPLTGKGVGTAYEVPEGSATPLGCDIDADGRQEIVYYAGSWVVALRFDGSAWSRVWALNLNEGITSLVYGDITGDGKGELITATGAGRLYVIGD